MAITLVMMGAVVTLFANVSNSVRNRRAVVEMAGQLRHVRNVLQRDLEGATCPGLVWQRPEENQGYIEIIEGPNREGQASVLIDADPDATAPTPTNWPPTATNPEIDHATSILPASNLPFNSSPNKARWVTDGAGLGDADDILMLTVRNEHEPFVGRVPESDSATKTSSIRPDEDDAAVFGTWSSDTIESPLAEVVWYAVENPGYTYDPNVAAPFGDVEPSADGFFGEPGMRTVYRRTLLVAPWINPYRFIDTDGTIVDTFQIGGSGPTFTAKPGLVRVLPDNVDPDEAHEALAALVAFQEAYDLSVRLEFDPLLDAANGGRWKIVANTLGDLTKRENRYEHHFYRRNAAREFPYAVVSKGGGYQGSSAEFIPDPDLGGPAPGASASANLADEAGVTDLVASYSIDAGNLDDNVSDPNRRYIVRPFAYVDDDSDTLATARAMLNDEGEVVRVVHGLVPLSGDRRGQDVMLTDVLGFDLRVYDPGAPLYQESSIGIVIDPGDPAWRYGYDADVADIDSVIGPDAPNDTSSALIGQGAYVDLGYGFGRLIPRTFFGSVGYGVTPWFFASPLEIENTQSRYPSDSTPGYVLNRGVLSDVYHRSRPAGDGFLSQFAPGYAVYDTWSFHYENNGVNEDQYRFDGSAAQEVDTAIDEGTNALDDVGSYTDSYLADAHNPRLGPDDVGERETAPPFDRPLRSVQVVLRLYERDSRQIRQVRVNQSFVPE